ncbi:MAG: hypothetical protein AB4426_01770 [Xenococcaceae cyanobacterium]
MNTQENQDWERKFQELEAEINQSSSPSPARETKSGQPQPQTQKSQQIESFLTQIRDWFNSLPTPGRVAVVVVTMVVGFSLLNTVLRLVASLLSIAILGVVLYLLYKFFIAPRSSE